MGSPVSTRVGSLTWKVAVAIFTAQLCPRDTEGFVPLGSELVCWALIAAFCQLLPRFREGLWKDNGVALDALYPQLCWRIPASLIVTTIAFSTENSAWILPAITGVLATSRRTNYLPRLHHSYPDYVQSAWFPIGAAAASIVVLAPSLSYSKLVFAVMAYVGQLGLYDTLIRIFEPNTERNESYGYRSLNTVVKDISYRVLVGLALLAVALPLVSSHGSAPYIVRIFLVGSIKAIHWIVMFWVVQEAPWDIATTIWTCAAASRGSFDPDVSASLGLFQTLSRLLVAALAMYHTVSLVPKSTRGRYLLYGFALWPIVALLNHTPLNGGVSLLPGEIWTQKPSGSDVKPSLRHPIDDLIRKAQVDFALLVDGQSKSLAEAESEYRKRYMREPPPGFDKWYTYAQTKQSVIIDNFDMIYDDLKPFWHISPQRLLESIDHVSGIEDLALRKCGFTNGQYHGQGGGWIVEDLGRLLDEVSQDIPDVEFAFDVVDEPRVVITQAMLDTGGVSKPEFQNERHHSIWGRVTGPCHDTITKSPQTFIHDHGVPFVQDWYQAKDVCQHPEFQNMHGFFSSPATCLLTDAPIPVLSQAAPTSFGDIMYPSPWYTEKVDQGDYKDDEDPPWEQKSNTLYWAGSTTGSHSTKGSWRHSHRQRLVQLVQTLNETNHRYLKEVKPGAWGSYEAVEDHRDLFDVKLTGIIQCDDEDCEEQKKYFQLTEKEDRSQQFRSRFVFDVDGNSFSGRYYTLLQSRSVVLKQTVLEEWHDERLIPWIHFVPISLSMEELPEVMRYFAEDEGGKRQAKEIADASREWHKAALRKEDFTIYLYRLMLELARIMDPNRQVEKAA